MKPSLGHSRATSPASEKARPISTQRRGIGVARPRGQAKAISKIVVSGLAMKAHAGGNKPRPLWATMAIRALSRINGKRSLEGNEVGMAAH